MTVGRWILRGALILLLVIVVVAVGAVVVWELGTHGPEAGARKAYAQARDRDGWYEFGERGAGVGVVIYPGAKVDAEAYAEVARDLSRESGALVAVVRVPLDFALVDTGAAEGVMEAHPKVGRWVVAGHSLGGVAASSFADDNAEVEGLLLWASYPSGGSDLSDEDIEVESLYGSRDGVLNRGDLREAKSRLPDSTRYEEITGMNHAQFGDYGPQPGDRKPAIPDDEARREVVSSSSDLLQRVR